MLRKDCGYLFERCAEVLNYRGTRKNNRDKNGFKKKCEGDDSNCKIAMKERSLALIG